MAKDKYQVWIKLTTTIADTEKQNKNRILLQTSMQCSATSLALASLSQLNTDGLPQTQTCPQTKR